MAYCTVADIQGEFKAATFGATSSPTDTTVTGFIAQAGAEIDATLGLKYATPITGATSLLIVKQIAIDLVAARVKNILEVKSPIAQGQQAIKGDDSATAARKRLKAIIVGQELTLPDATILSSNDGVESFDVSNGEEFVFQKGVKQW